MALTDHNLPVVSGNPNPEDNNDDVSRKNGNGVYKIGFVINKFNALIQELIQDFNNVLSSRNTDELPEGSTNFYFTQARFDSSLSSKNTDNLSEGTTNLYITDARVRAAISVQGNGSYNPATGIITISATQAVDHISLTSQTANVDTYTVWGDAGETLNLGTFTVTNGLDGNDGTNGIGWTGGSYNPSTGIVTFTSTDGLGFATSDLRGSTGATGSVSAASSMSFDEQASSLTEVAAKVLLYAKTDKDLYYKDDTATEHKILKPSKVNAYTANQHATPVTLTDAANIALDASQSNVYKVTLGGNRVLDNPSNTKNGQTFLLHIYQDGTGSRTLAYGSNFKFSGGVPTLSTAANAEDMLSCVVDGTSIKCVFTGGFE